MLDNRDRIARLIDPIAFKSWDGMHAHCIAAGDDEEEAKATADWAYKPAIDAAYAKADAILALALPAVAVGDGWRSIETAPKDGTPFLAFNPFVGVYHTAYTVRWTGAEDEYDAAMAGKPTYEGFPCCFKSNAFADWPYGKWDVAPTHWRPLPAPPHGGGDA